MNDDHSNRLPVLHGGSQSLSRYGGSPFLVGTTHRDESFSVPNGVFRNHMLITGATQRGKSYYTELLVRELAKDSGIIVLDPHGPLVERLKVYFASQYDWWDRVIYFDINDPKNIVGYNPFIRRPQVTVSKQVDLIMDACLRVWGHRDYSETPRLQRWLRVGFELLIRMGLSFVEAYHLFSLAGGEKRDAILQQARDTGAADFLGFEMFDWFQRLRSEQLKEQQLESSYNRIAGIVLDEQARMILGQRGERSIDLLDVINSRKILLVNLAPARVGSNVSKLIAALMMNEVYNLAYIDRNTQSPPVYVVMDEFSKIGTRTIKDALSETAKFNVFWVLITQYLEQLYNVDEGLLKSAFTNCLVKACFGGMDIEDCDSMALELFAGQYLTDEVKSWQTKFRPVQDMVDEISETKGGAETVTDADSETKNQSETRGYSDSSQDSHKWNEGAPELTSYGYGSSDFSSRTSGSSKTTGTNKGRSSTWSRTRKQVLQTRYKEFREEGSFYTLDEQHYKFRSLLKMMAQQYAAVKFDELPADVLRIADVEDLDLLPELVETFLDDIADRPYVLPVADAKRQLEQHKTELFGSPGQPGEPDSAGVQDDGADEIGWT